ncbi:unnamed protein product [Orchesella dallaii]|uniref:Uncharacterized protein n=1 Tax=Orchesella dallaii TaxID=48710 RepID=A0ABP1R6N1_9HEXA
MFPNIPKLRNKISTVPGSRNGINTEFPVPFPKPKLNIFEVGEAFYPLINSLSWMGISSLTSKGGGAHYQIGGARVIIFILIMSIAVIFFVTVWTLNRAFNIFWPTRL